MRYSCTAVDPFAWTENEMLSVFEEKEFEPSKDDMIKADDIV